MTWTHVHDPDYPDVDPVTGDEAETFEPEVISNVWMSGGLEITYESSSINKSTKGN